MKQNASISTENGSKSTPYVILIVIIAALGGLLFGYDQGVISGAVNFIDGQFKMGDSLLGFISGCIPLGAMVGCLVAGYMADKIGRKLVLFTAAILFILSSFGCALAHSVGFLIVSRLIGGLGVGMASTLVPLYIAEIAPEKIRGTMVGGYQLAVASGIFVVYIVNAIIANTHTLAWNEHFGWRWMFAAGAVPGLLFFLLLFLIPESPRFLVKNGDESRAENVLQKVQGNNAPVKKQVTEIRESLQEENKGFWGELFSKGFRMAFFVAIVAAIMQQLTGVSAVAYYAPVIFKAAGAGTNASLIETVLIGLVKVLFVIVFMFLVDKIGRKKLLLWGSALMALCLFGLGFAFTTSPFTKLIDGFILALILLHTIAFELSWGGGAWVLISEIFPNRIRGRASSLASCTLWLATYLVTQFFPIMLSKLGSSWTYVIFGLFCVIMYLFTKYMIPETKEKSLEQIQKDWVAGSNG